MILNPASTQLVTARCRALIALPAASLLLAAGAHAQSSGCEDFRNKLAARVDPSITAFTLDIVRSSEPVPPGAKVFGTCDGGAYKILFRRGGTTRPAPAASSTAAAPASAPVRAAAAPPPPPKPVAAPASAPSPAPRASLAAPAVAPAPVPQALKPAGASASPVVVARVPDRVEAPAVVQAPLAEAAGAQAAPEPEGPGFMARYGQWIAALLLLLIAGGLWAWWAHRNAYDEAGLPRGPRL
jgi:hypothetical protein